MSPIRKEVIVGDCRLLLGDCVEILPTLSKVDAVITDPPYGVGFAGKRAKQRNGDVSHREGGYDGFDDTPEYVKDVAVWVIEACMGAVKSIAVTPGTRCAFLYPQPDDIGCFYTAAGTGLGKWGFSCSQPILFYGSDPYLANKAGARANSCGQKFPNDANDIEHPCAKPLPQMMWLVNRASWNGDLVLDPFMGSGTTGVACVKSGRSFIGIEQNETYFDIACERIRKAYAQPDMFVQQRHPEPKQEAMF